MRNFVLFFLLLVSLILIGCETTKEITQDDQIIEESEIIEEETDEITTETLEDVIEIDEEPEAEEVIQEEIEEIEDIYVDTDDVEFIEDEIPEVDEEYLRSIGESVTSDEISPEEFLEDKLAILQIIDELSDIMEKNDVDAWVRYLDDESKRYYSNPANLRKAQRKLPNKLINLKTIKDYFINVFIPARMASNVDEIRYISKTEVRAVEVKEDGGIVVYYYFKKIKGQWYINLPVV